MKKSQYLLLASITIHLSLLSNSQASEFQIHKVELSKFEALTSKISTAVESDDNKIEILPFDATQTFELSQKQEKIGYLIPLKFNSKAYKNTICRLYFLDRQESLEYVNLFAEKNDDEDIVTSCVGVEAVAVAVAINNQSSSSFDYLAIIRTRLANTYRSSGVVVGFDRGRLTYNQKLVSCINTGRPITTINALRKKNQACSKE